MSDKFFRSEGRIFKSSDTEAEMYGSEIESSDLPEFIYKGTHRPIPVKKK